MFDYENDIGVFGARLLCGNCGENVMISGNYTVDVEADDEDEAEMHYYTVVEPKYFTPPLRIITVDDRTPPVIHQLIRSASEVFWCSGESCINRLRCVTEEILNFLGVPSSTENGGYMPLHQRIDQLSAEHQKLKEALFAAKHMGNDASHGSFEVTRDELLDAFVVVEYCLGELFPQDKSAVLAIIGSVNKNKGFRPKVP